MAYAWLATGPAHATGRPYVPASDATVLEHLPSNADARVRRFNALRRKLAAKPDDVAGKVALARSYLEYGRATGDARYLGRAEAVLAPAMARDPAPIDAMLVQATILQNRHQFAETRTMLKAILARDRDNAQAWLTLSSVALVQGDMVEARRACSHLIGSANTLVTAGCIGSLSSVNGKAESTLELVSTALQREPDAPASIRSWAHGLLADAARSLGQDRRADSEFRTALRLAPGDNFLLADYADFLLDRARPQEALALVKDHSASDTSFLRQVLAEAALGSPATPAHVALMASRFSDLEQRGESALLGREEARFALELQHDPRRALKLALDNWKYQRAPEDMRILMAAALAAGQPRQALPAVELLKRTRLQDPKIRALGVEIERRVGGPRPVARKTP